MMLKPPTEGCQARPGKRSLLLFRVWCGVLPTRPIVLEEYMDDKGEEMVLRKSLKYLFLSVGLDEAGVLELLQK